MTELITPASFDSLSSNKPYTVRLRMDGYYDKIVESVRIIPDSTVIISPTLLRVMHPLTVISEPAGAVIYIDGIEQGEAPVSIGSIAEGNHSLLTIMDGYKPKQIEIDVTATNSQIRVKLDSMPPGILILEIQPYADLWIDGELKESDAVNFPIELSPGEHLIKLHHPVYGDIEENVRIVSGEELRKKYNLETRSR
jgi:hypothetical protein